MPALLAEVDKVAEVRAALDRPAARRVHADHEHPLRLDEVGALFASARVVDACRHGLRTGATWWPLARRQVLFALARQHLPSLLAEGICGRAIPTCHQFRYLSKLHGNQR